MNYIFSIFNSVIDIPLFLVKILGFLFSKTKCPLDILCVIQANYSKKVIVLEWKKANRRIMCIFPQKKIHFLYLDYLINQHFYLYLYLNLA